MLENLTSKYRRPCVLDVKMGTSPFWVGGTESSEARRVDRYINTTSITLGTRLCGMQASDKMISSFEMKYNLFLLLIFCVIFAMQGGGYTQYTYSIIVGLYLLSIIYFRSVLLLA